MYGPQSLREYRTEMVATIASLSSGRVTASAASGGDIVRDVTANMIADFGRDVGEIERILTATGEPYDSGDRRFR